MATVADEISEAKLVAELKARGYTVIKEKEPDKTEPTKVTVVPSTKLNQFDIVNTTINPEKSQELERYTIEQIRQIFDYDIFEDYILRTTRFYHPSPHLLYPIGNLGGMGTLRFRGCGLDIVGYPWLDTSRLCLPCVEDV